MDSLSRYTEILRGHRGYIGFNLQNREGDTGKGFEQPLNQYEFAAGEIFYHGLYCGYKS